MSEMSRDARRAARAKAHRMVTATPGKVDASSYGPEEVLDAGVKTGARPVSRRAYKKGGKVVAMEGKDAVQHAGRKPRARKDGGMVADSFANVDMKEANEDRDGKKHVGGFKRGGRTGRDAGGEVPTTRFNIGAGESLPRKVVGFKRGGSAYEGTEKDKREDKKLAKKHHMTTKEWEGSALDEKHDAQRSTKGLKSGGSTDGKWIQGAIKHPGALRESLHVKEGKNIPAAKLEKAAHSDNPKLAKRARLAETLKRMHRKDGGRAGKGKTDINIIIGAGSRGPQQPMPDPTLGAPGAAPIPVPVGPPGLGAAGPAIPGGMPPVGAPPPMGPAGGPPMPMPRKRGGRTYASYKDMDAGSGSGDGRLEKTEIAKRKK